MPELKDILSEICRYLQKSQASDWTLFTPSEVFSDLQEAISRITVKLPIDRTKLKIHFGPSGPIQEISISNGWADEYLKLSEAFDRKIEGEYFQL